MGDEEDDEVEEIQFMDFPHRPRYAMPPPKRGERFAAYHRETLGRFSRKQPWLKSSRAFKEAPPYTGPMHDPPSPWESPSLTSPQPMITFPPKPPLFTEQKTYQWERSGYIPFFEKVYPQKTVEVQVTVTNDPIVVDEWAAARKSEGTTLYGFDTKFWTFDEKGTYFSDTYPRQWSDLALLQIADQKHVLLIQPLDMPVEALGPQIRSILSYKYIKKCGFCVMPKAKGMKMCDIAFHGVHDHLILLTRTLGLTSKRMLPLNVEQLDMTGMSMHLLGLDLDPELAASARWEKERLDEDMIEVAAKEAWCAWALYGIITRMNDELVIAWSRAFPKGKSPVAVAKQKELRRALMLSKSVTLEHVKEAEEFKANRRSLPKMTKHAAAELVLDAGIDLYEAVDQDELVERGNQAKIKRAAQDLLPREPTVDDSSQTYTQWDNEEIGSETWRLYLDEEEQSDDDIVRLGESPAESDEDALDQGDLTNGIKLVNEAEERTAEGSSDEETLVEYGEFTSSGFSEAQNITNIPPTGSTPIVHKFDEDYSIADDFDQSGIFEEEPDMWSSSDDEDSQRNEQDEEHSQSHRRKSLQSANLMKSSRDTLPKRGQNHGFPQKKKTWNHNTEYRRSMSTSLHHESNNGPAHSSESQRTTTPSSSQDAVKKDLGLIHHPEPLDDPEFDQLLEFW